MKHFLISAVIAAATITTPALASDVGVSISIGEPGFYGRLDIGEAPPPRVIYSYPVIIDRRVPRDRPPIYLHVPPGYAKHWDKHCHEYNACGEYVFFVHDDWYEREYVSYYSERHHDHDRRDDRRDEYRDDDHGNGRGHDHGHDHDHDR